jgi:hypothetical protein
MENGRTEVCSLFAVFHHLFLNGGSTEKADSPFLYLKTEKG